MTDNLVRRFAVAGLLCAVTLTAGCHHRAAPAPLAPAGPSLYDRLGGHDAVALVVGDFVSRVGADARINAFFRGVDLDELKRLLGEQICQAAGGPCRYSGRPMRVAHAGLHIQDADFNALVEDLTAALGRYNVPAREQQELLTALGGMRRDIVGR
jgi:hemoglobin